MDMDKATSLFPICTENLKACGRAVIIITRGYEHDTKNERSSEMMIEDGTVDLLDSE